MIKVIHFIDRIGRGGTQAVLYDWLKHIDRSKVQFDFLVFMDGQEEYIEKFKDSGCNIYQLSNLSMKKIPKFMNELDVFFKNHHYDIVHGHSKIKNVFFLYAAMKNGVKVRISHSHNTQFQKFAGLGLIMKPMLKCVATDYFACSDIAGIWLYGKNAYEQGKIKIIKNGVETDKFTYSELIRNEYRGELDLVDSVVYGHVGKYMEQKNHTFLIEIFSEIIKKQSNAKLVLIGSGYPDIIELVNNKIKSLGLEEVVIQLGLRTDVPMLMQAMDVFLLPSLYEGLPVVGVEAQAAGLPLLLSDTITREVGLLSSTKYMSLAKSPEEWAAEAIDLSQNYKTCRSETSKEVYNFGYDSRLVAKELVDAYCSLLERAGM